jgi:hypothetical protein
VRALLAEHFQPTFDDKPQWLAALEQALELVKADLRASGLPDAVRLYSWEGSTNVSADAWAANSTSGGIPPRRKGPGDGPGRGRRRRSGRGHALDLGSLANLPGAPPRRPRARPRW